MIGIFGKFFLYVSVGDFLGLGRPNELEAKFKSGFQRPFHQVEHRVAASLYPDPDPSPGSLRLFTYSPLCESAPPPLFHSLSLSPLFFFIFPFVPFSRRTSSV